MQYYDYGFPYKPYAIQLDFVRDLQQAYRTGAIAIMESPTGTVSPTHPSAHTPALRHSPLCACEYTRRDQRPDGARISQSNDVSSPLFVSPFSLGPLALTRDLPLPPPLSARAQRARR